MVKPKNIFSRCLPVITILGVIVGIGSLVFTCKSWNTMVKEAEKNEDERTVALLMDTNEAIKSAREGDKNKSAVTRNKKDIFECSKIQLSERKSQIEAIQILAGQNKLSDEINLENLNLGSNRNNAHGIKLNDTNLAYFKLKGSNLKNAEFNRTDLFDADLSSTCMKGAELNNAILIKANFRRADLTEANFSDADFTMALLRFTNLSGTNLSGANFREAKGLTQSQLDEACSNKDRPPINLPTVKGKQLIWNGKRCRG